VAEKLKAMKLTKAAALVAEFGPETLSYYAYPSEHWRRIRTNNPMERIMREIRRRTRVVGAFPDGEPALMLVAARLRYVAGASLAIAGTWTWIFCERCRQRLSSPQAEQTRTRSRTTSQRMCESFWTLPLGGPRLGMSHIFIVAECVPEL
jgi:hypothetical protein